MRNDARRTADIIHVPYPLTRASWASWSSQESCLSENKRPDTLPKSRDIAVRVPGLTSRVANPRGWLRSSYHSDNKRPSAGEARP